MKTVDLFCGCGGLSLGLTKAGYEVLQGFDSWDSAIAVYAENFDHPVSKLDLNDVEAAIAAVSAHRPEVIAGGPPCQEFSHAGTRTEGAKANLTANYAKIVTACRVPYFIMENVDRALTSKAFAEASAIFREAGYGLSINVLDASRCGTPQKRKRLFVLGGLGQAEGFLDEILLSKVAPEPMTLRQYLGDECDFDFYYRHPRNYSRRGVFSVDEPAPTMRGVNRPVPKTYQAHPGDAAPAEGLKALTTYHRSRVQTFPKDFKWKGTKTDIEQMIGNAVPVELGTFVGKALLEYVEATACKNAA